MAKKDSNKHIQFPVENIKNILNNQKSLPFEEEDPDFPPFDDEELEIMKFDFISPEERKEIFTNLSNLDKNKISDDELSDVYLVTQAIFLYDVTDVEFVDKYFDRNVFECEIPIDDELFTNQSLGVEHKKFTKKQLNDFGIDIQNHLKVFTENKNQFDILRKKWGDLPLLSYYESIWYLKNDNRQYYQKIVEFNSKFPDYPLLKLELIKAESFDNPSNEKFDLKFKTIFKNRKSITGIEMLEYQLTKISMIEKFSLDLMNELEGQNSIISELYLSEEYMKPLQSFLLNIQVNALKNYFKSSEKSEMFIKPPSSDKTFQFKIQLKNVSNPTVWRRLQMPSNATFKDFHDAIQLSFGWENEHLFMFSPGGYGSFPVIEMDVDSEDEHDDFFNSIASNDSFSADIITLDEIFLREKQSYTYIYDFGDDWIHNIMLEKIIDEPVLCPVLLKGKGACPPEDCGGAWGFENFKRIIGDKKDPEHKEMKAWLGLGKNDVWNPDEFDIKHLQENLRFFLSKNSNK